MQPITDLGQRRLAVAAPFPERTHDPVALRRAICELGVATDSTAEFLALLAEQTYRYVERVSDVVAFRLRPFAESALSDSLACAGGAGADLAEAMARAIAAKLRSNPELRRGFVTSAGEVVDLGAPARQGRVAVAVARQDTSPHFACAPLEDGERSYVVVAAAACRQNAFRRQEFVALRELSGGLCAALELRRLLAARAGEHGAAANLTEQLRKLHGQERGEPVDSVRASSVWSEFCEGRWSLVAHGVDGQGRLLLMRRKASGQGSACLSAREKHATAVAMRGGAAKVIASELEIGHSAAATLVYSAIAKLGLRSRVELKEVFGAPPVGWTLAPGSSAAPANEGDTDGTAAIAAATEFRLGASTYALLELPVRKLRPPPVLTEAEQDVVSHVLNARSNDEIARARRTSRNTVANQLHAVYVKLGISGRAELIHACG